MKRLLLVFAVMALMLAAMAVPAFAVSGSASQQGCFGQARAADASGPNRGGTEGQILASRRGDNAPMNAAFRNACQA